METGLKEHTSQTLRTVAVIGHGSVGKTSLCDAMLYAAGAVERLGSVSDGSSVFDFTSESRDRKQSLSASRSECASMLITR